MTENKRIVLNVLASYGRSLFAMGMGLYSARWVLKALGKADFGLFGLVGSIIMFVGLLNGILGSAVSRYYAFAIGEARTLGVPEGRDHMIRWFNAALSIHAFLPTVLVVIGYPIGIYAINHWLVIPSERLPACIVVFRLVLFSALVGMMSVPYTAMYQARQLITELAFWGVLQTTAMFFGAYLLLSWDGDRLVAYATYTAIVPVVITLAQIYRAKRNFGVCEIRTEYLFSSEHLKKLFVFAAGELFGWLGGAIRDNGMAFLINLKFGVGMNASYNVGQQVSNHSTSLSSAMIGAFVPAVSSAAGQGDRERIFKLTYTSMKLGVLLIGLFAIPLMIEIDEVLRLWLQTPPKNSNIFACSFLLALMVQKIGWGFHLALLAMGRIVVYQITVGTVGAMGILLAIILVYFGLGVWGIGIAIVVNFMIICFARSVFARCICGFPIRQWIFKIVVPVTIACFVVLLGGYSVTVLLQPSFVRVCITTIVCTLLLTAISWFLICDDEERQYLLCAAQKIKTRIIKAR